MLAQTLATVERREEFDSTIKSYKRLKNQMDSLVTPEKLQDYYEFRPQSTGFGA